MYSVVCLEEAVVIPTISPEKKPAAVRREVYCIRKSLLVLKASIQMDGCLLKFNIYRTLQIRDRLSLSSQNFLKDFFIKENEASKDWA